MARETLGSRLGFLLLSAGCAVGLGNIWRFPFITGKFGGAAFVLMYLVFLVILGLPILTMELAVGRGSQRNLFGAAKVLPAKPGPGWSFPVSILFAGNVILMIFYTTITGWLFAWTYRYLVGGMEGVQGAAAVGAAFGEMTGSATQCVGWMLLVVVLGSVVCSLGLRKGVEGSAKFMMSGLFLLLILLCVKAVTLPNASEGLKFYLMPRLADINLSGAAAALGQAFFTLSIGIGSMTIFGSYTSKERSLTSEAAIIIGLDTMVALLAGLVIFPACSSGGVEVNAGPGLVFVSLPTVFNNMAGGRWWGLVFFFFMSLAAFTTVIAVFENLIALLIDECRLSRPVASIINGVAIALLSLPCALGFNLWSSFQPFGAGSCVLDLEDYIVSNNLLILGGIYLALMCTLKSGWGWDNFLAEANTGKGFKFARCLKFYVKWVIPVLVGILFVKGFLDTWKIEIPACVTEFFCRCGK